MEKKVKINYTCPICRGHFQYSDVAVSVLPDDFNEIEHTMLCIKCRRQMRKTIRSIRRGEVKAVEGEL